MLVLFKENYECVIKDIVTIKIGDMLCDLLNLDLTHLKKLEMDLLSLFRSIDILATGNKLLDEGTVSNYLELLEANDELLKPFKKKMAELPFYRYTRDVENAFSLLIEFKDGICRQLKARSPQIMILDAQISYDTDLLKKAIVEIILPIKTTIACSQYFHSIVDRCLLYDPVNAEKKPIGRLKEYGLDKFNEQAGKVVKYTHAAQSPALSLLYEIVEDNGNLSLVQCFDFATLPQFIYQEFMKMVGLNLNVRHCKNCGKFFVIYSERILEYCGNIPEGESKPCSVIGPLRQYNKKVKNDPILDIYTRAYKKYVARRRSGNISPEEFIIWSTKARELRDKAYNEKTSTDEFTVWMQ